MRIAHSVVKCVRSNGQGPICGAVKRSSNKNDGQNFLTSVAAVTTAPIAVTTPCHTTTHTPHTHHTPPTLTDMVDFTDEEGYGKYLDLHQCYDCYINLKQLEVSQPDYVCCAPIGVRPD